MKIAELLKLTPGTTVRVAADSTSTFAGQTGTFREVTPTRGYARVEFGAPENDGLLEAHEVTAV